MKSNKAKKDNIKRHNHLSLILSLSIVVPLTVILVIIGIINNNKPSEIIENVVDTLETNYKISENPVPAYIQDDRGGITEDNSIPTMEEVDGGQFKDKDTGLSITDGEYADLGWSETYNVSSPEAFKNATLNRCIIANNYYGAQCVSLARVFWWSYADRDVSTCGTGAAKGMMDCAAENAGDDFLIYWSDDYREIQAGDWLVFNGGQYGHIGMALGPVVNGYVTLLGENQGGHSCGDNVGGSATNIININIKNLIGFYRPIAYVKPEPTPEPEPETPEVPNCKVLNIEWGDTLGDIMLLCEGSIDWSKMNDYAKKWFSLDVNPEQSVFSGWNSETGVGLFSGDRIEYRD